jgi:NADPH-dependent 2,4-dienoyl-CoA reductase/sulfur reductase-like enzyme
MQSMSRSAQYAETVMSKMNVGAVCRALILKAEESGKAISNEDLAAKVVQIFEEHGVEVKTSAACIAWYKSDMRKKGELIGKAQAKSITIDLDTVEL